MRCSWNGIEVAAHANRATKLHVTMVRERDHSRSAGTRRTSRTMHNTSSTKAATANSGSINWHAPLSKMGWATVMKVQVMNKHATTTSAAALNH